jgi:hypothetical protein
MLPSLISHGFHIFSLQNEVVLLRINQQAVESCSDRIENICIGRIGQKPVSLAASATGCCWPLALSSQINLNY